MAKDYIITKDELESFGLSSQGYQLQTDVYDESCVALKLDFYHATGEKHKDFDAARTKAMAVIGRIERELGSKYDVSLNESVPVDSADVLLTIGKKGDGNIGQRHKGEQFTFPKTLLADIENASTAAFHAEGISEDFGYTRVEFAAAMEPHTGKVLTPDLQNKILQALAQPKKSMAR